jgi:hypothetical protein
VVSGTGKLHGVIEDGRVIAMRRTVVVKVRRLF